MRLSKKTLNQRSVTYTTEKVTKDLSENEIDARRSSQMHLSVVPSMNYNLPFEILST